MRPDARSAIAIALLVLGLGVRAAAGEPGEGDEAAGLLLAPELRSDQARASEASDLLSAERSQKFADLSADFVDLGIQASLQVSPLKLFRAARRIGRGMRDWDDRTDVEDEALALLAPGVRSGDLDAASLALYARLERRESEARVQELLADAERAFGAGDLRRTLRTIDRALALEPGSSRADRLLDAIDEREWRSSSDDVVATEQDPEAFAIDPWELKLATALLLDDLHRARELGPSDANDAAFARATARYLGGDRPGALHEFSEIARGDDSAARSAAELLADPEVDPAAEFDKQVWLYRARRALGWMGGPELAEAAVPSSSNALSLSREGYDLWRVSYEAWRTALDPVNLMIDAPVRVWRSWQPDGRNLRSAASRYLDLVPEGDKGADAVAWLDELGKHDRNGPKVSAFHDGVLVLPHPKTSWTRLASTRIVVARDALAAVAPELPVELPDDARALLLALDTEAGRPANTGRGAPLSRGVSLDLLSRLAVGIERGTLASRGDLSSTVLASLRRLDARVRAGGTLVASAWTEDVASGAEALEAALADGKRSHTIGDFELERRDENFSAERPLGSDHVLCPTETPCIELRRALEPIFYTNADTSGDVGVGARASFDAAQLSLEVGTSGPRASLVIPVARWLGIDRYFPVAAHLAVGLDGISASPHRRDASRDVPDPSL